MVWRARPNCAFDQKTNLQYLSGYQLYGFVDSGVAWNDGYRLSDGLSLTSAGARRSLLPRRRPAG
jgi:hypothetical protein